ncbi:MAG: hypothetical protein C5B54_00290, partial [Acidobacteria bacterium]
MANPRFTRLELQITRVAQRLGLCKKLLFGATGLAAIIGPIVFGLHEAPQSYAQSPAQSTPATTLKYE